MNSSMGLKIGMSCTLASVSAFSLQAFTSTSTTSWGSGRCKLQAICVGFLPKTKPCQVSSLKREVKTLRSSMREPHP